MKDKLKFNCLGCDFPLVYVRCYFFVVFALVVFFLASPLISNGIHSQSSVQNQRIDGFGGSGLGNKTIVVE